MSFPGGDVAEFNTGGDTTLATGGMRSIVLIDCVSIIKLDAFLFYDTHMTMNNNDFYVRITCVIRIFSDLSSLFYLTTENCFSRVMGLTG